MFADPLKNLKIFDIRENMLVADLGAGTGFYSLLSSSFVPNGKVYAVDINKDFLKTISNQAKDKNIKNLECLHGDLEKKEGSNLKSNLIDRVIISNILFMIEDRKSFLKEAHRILKENGKILFVDFDPNSILISRTKHKTINKEEARAILEEADFVYERDISTGHHHYGMIFIKKTKKQNE